jgi:hypothetical protein
MISKIRIGFHKLPPNDFQHFLMRGEVKQKKKKNSEKRFLLEIEFKSPLTPFLNGGKGGFVIFVICG